MWETQGWMGGMFSGYELGVWVLGTDAVKDGAGERPCLWAPGRTVGLILLKNGSPLEC